MMNCNWDDNARTDKHRRLERLGIWCLKFHRYQKRIKNCRRRQRRPMPAPVSGWYGGMR